MTTDLSEVWTSVDHLLTTSMTRLLQAIQYRWQESIGVYYDSNHGELLEWPSLLINTVDHVAWLMTSEIDYQASRLMKWIARRYDY